nr:hypothetical protein BaRGS_019498 [Batillaria attramentaria]
MNGTGEPNGSETVRWSKWFNSDRPWIGQGDFETTDVIERHHTICYSDQEVVSAQCRVAGSNVTFGPKTPDSEGDRLLQACTTHGVICLNVQQPSGRCKDYEVRFLCQDIDDTHPGSLFPNFDFKIYLVLIAVPLVVIMLRVLCDGDDVSIDPALANPPPAYSELFGSVRSNVFAISGGFCLGHSKCVHWMHKPVFLFPRNSSVTSFTEPPDYEQALEILKKNEAELGSVYM